MKVTTQDILIITTTQNIEVERFTKGLGGNTVGAYIWSSGIKVKNKHKRIPKQLLALGLKNVVGRNKSYREFKTIDDAKRWIKTENLDFHELFTVEI